MPLSIKAHTKKKTLISFQIKKGKIRKLHSKHSIKVSNQLINVCINKTDVEGTKITQN